MTKVSNSEIKREAANIFSYGRQDAAPFYNREESKKEIVKKCKTFQSGDVLFLSALLGAGKSFFIDHIGWQLGKTENSLFIRDVTKKLLKRKNDILFFDEADIKTSWEDLRRGLTLIAEHIVETGQKAVIVGDYCLYAGQLAGIFNRKDYLNSFEPLDRIFLKGILESRISTFLNRKNPEPIVDEALMNILVPEEMTPVATFRTILTMLARLVRRLPANNEPCMVTLDTAKKWVQEEYDPNLETYRQEDYLNILLDYFNREYPGGKGLQNGLKTKQLFDVASETKTKYESIAEFESEIIVPFTRNELLISNGVPFLNEKGDFVRRPEPFLPSIPLLLLAEI
ncbi:MAG: hypothetical protein NT166_03380 [Candidatus Aminicenantes bacterium]|nr:hypothetical protein [Candidatus Aminicenantes bacterium]